MEIIWDSTLLLFVTENLRHPAATVFFQVLTVSGSAASVWLLTAGGLLLKKKYHRHALGILCALLIAFTVTDGILKPLIQRKRPWVQEKVTPLGPKPSSSSFPSGHAATTFAAATAVCLFFRNRAIRAAALSYAVLMAFSRVYLGLHYPLDILAGSAIGICCGTVATTVVKLRSSGCCPDDPAPPT